MIDMVGVLQRLAVVRPVFALESDFQEALKRQIEIDYPGARVTREVPKTWGTHRAFIDLAANLDGQHTFIELKYKSTSAEYVVGGQCYRLRKQSAQDQGRYDCLKDLSRLESFVKDHLGSEGWAIFLTNDRSYWSSGIKVSCQDREFKLPEGRLLSGTLRWAEGSGIGSIRGREDPIELLGAYRVAWTNYSTFAGEQTPDFRALVVRVV